MLVSGEMKVGEMECSVVAFMQCNEIKQNGTESNGEYLSKPVTST